MITFLLLRVHVVCCPVHHHHCFACFALPLRRCIVTLVAREGSGKCSDFFSRAGLWREWSKEKWISGPLVSVCYRDFLFFPAPHRPEEEEEEKEKKISFHLQYLGLTRRHIMYDAVYSQQKIRAREPVAGWPAPVAEESRRSVVRESCTAMSFLSPSRGSRRRLHPSILAQSDFAYPRYQ